MKAGQYIVLLTLLFSTAIYAANEGIRIQTKPMNGMSKENTKKNEMTKQKYLQDLFKERYRSNLGNYNTHIMRGYQIQKPVPPSWYYEGCRQGDYNCIQRYMTPHRFVLVPRGPDILENLR